MICFRPLAGICCFFIKYALIERKKFPPPCGDMLFPTIVDAGLDLILVSVPLRGYVVSFEKAESIANDVSFRPLAGICCFGGIFHADELFWFPSPCGDMLFLLLLSSSSWLMCFRPLAGICCFQALYQPADARPRFPSPCGDMLFRRS